MPRIVSKEERQLTQDAIYNNTIKLIKDKGIRSVTIDDITAAVGIGKGSFYTYYPSKEAWLYDVIKRCEREIFVRMEEIMKSIDSDSEKAICLMKEIYTAKDSLISYVSQSDVEMLLRKLPKEYHERERQKAENNFLTALRFMKLEHHQMEVVAILTDCLSFVSSNRTYGRSSINEAVNIMIYALANYIKGEKKNE